MSLKNTMSYKTASGATPARGKTALDLLLFAKLLFPLVILLMIYFRQQRRADKHFNSFPRHVVLAHSLKTALGRPARLLCLGT